MGRQWRNDPVDDKEVKGRYEEDILLHAGIRLIGKCYKTFFMPLI
jgi:3-oxoacyl-ACP reductase-like protein